MPLYPELKNKVVLITGGANGIGEATVRAFHQQGARVFFCDIDSKAGAAFAAELGGDVGFSRVDLMQERQIKKWIAQIARREKTIHALVNNAASDPRIPLEKTSTELWDQLFARNLRAYFLCVREAVPFMVAGSSIINLASITFHNAPAQMAAYVGTKGGVLGFTRSLARELGPRRIRVNAVSPGWIMTERQLRQYVTPAVKRLLRTAQSIPDLIQPAEIAQVILFLASAGSSAVTGQEILADRGWYHS
ncbi:MAG: SDR family oxidoreductase [Verrucomicrobiota bacterium]|jgi:D-xylose 1-dehydrogenase